MSLIPAKLGAERKKLGFLAALVVIAIAMYFWNRNSGDPGGPTRPAGNAAPAGAAAQRGPIRTGSRAGVRVTQSGMGRNPREYRPSMKPPKDVDPSSLDPTLHLASLARLQDVKLEGSTRSLFEISAAPPVELRAIEPGKIKIERAFVGPKPPPPPPPPPPTPKAPPIPLKFYGFVNPARPDVKRAFFLQDEEIIVAGEGDLIKKRYKIIRIGINSAEVEDTEFKGDNTKQTLPLETEMKG